MNQALENRTRPAWHDPHAAIRSDAYILLATLLNEAPSEETLDIVRNLDWDSALPEPLQESLAALNRAGAECPPDSITREFHRLFVGLGSGELVPYGSWYREKMIQSGPLAAIRSDLGRLGIVRQTDTFESEDHAGALCEIMALLSSSENDIADRQQAAFFKQHIDPWLPQFFSDLEAVDNARFYQAVGLFGCRFLQGENDFLKDTASAEMNMVSTDNREREAGA